MNAISTWIENVAANYSDGVITKVFGGSVVGSAILASLLGNSFGFLAKFFLIIEFIGLIHLFNVPYDTGLGHLLNLLTSFTEMNMVPLPSEKVLQGQISNSIAS